MPSNSKEVQVFVPVQTSTTNDFTDVIKRIFKDLPVEWKLCDAYEKLSKKIPLVVVCQISSRFEPDIDLALNGIKREEGFVVIILHTGLKRHLPSLPTASKLANKEKYKNIKFIDIAFNVDDKFYQCEMNTTAIGDLLESFFDDKQQIKKRESIGESNVLDESRQQAKNDRDALSSTSTSEGANCLDSLRKKGIDPQNQNHSGSKDENCQQTQYDGDAMTNNFTTKGSDIQNKDVQDYEFINLCDVPTHDMVNSDSSEQRNSTNGIGKCTGESNSRNFLEIRPSNSKEVQVLVPVQTTMTKAFTDAIECIFKKLSFKCKLCDSYEHISKMFPFVVVCQISSGFESDIDLALSGIKREDVFLVLIFHTDLERNLPRIPSVSKLADKKEYKNIIQFIDIAYDRNDKLYECQMNSIARDSLKNFCTKFF